MASKAKLQERINRLMPGGTPRWIRCYKSDDGMDQYTVVFSGRTAVERSPGNAPEYPYRAMCDRPFHAQGVGQWGSHKHQPVDTLRQDGRGGWAWPPAIGRKCHLGKRIKFSDLPPDCRKLVIRDYKEVWSLTTKAQQA